MLDSHGDLEEAKKRDLAEREDIAQREEAAAAIGGQVGVERKGDGSDEVQVRPMDEKEIDWFAYYLAVSRAWARCHHLDEGSRLYGIPGSYDLALSPETDVQAQRAPPHPHPSDPDPHVVHSGIHHREVQIRIYATLLDGPSWTLGTARGRSRRGGHVGQYRMDSQMDGSAYHKCRAS